MRGTEWIGEQDLLIWVDEKTGYWCRIRRCTNLRHLCGYVAVPVGHKYYLKRSWKTYPYVNVHGGITWSKFVKVDKKSYHEYGFDCGHLGDYSPGAKWHDDYRYETYRNWEYVKGEVESLARQLKELEK